MEENLNIENTEDQMVKSVENSSWTDNDSSDGSNMDLNEHLEDNDSNEALSYKDQMLLEELAKIHDTKLKEYEMGYHNRLSKANDKTDTLDEDSQLEMLHKNEETIQANKDHLQSGDSQSISLLDQIVNQGMITILVPNESLEAVIKEEPIDSDEIEGIDPGSLLSDYETEEEDEDFYIIQVTDGTDTARKRRKYTRRPHYLNEPNLTRMLVRCDKCDYCTPDKSNLRKHMFIHTDEKPFSCGQCPFTCKLLKYLKQHEMTHMTVRLYPCTICCHRCRNITELNRHLKRHLRIMNKTSLSEIGNEPTYCVCRDGCKATGDFIKVRRKHVE